MNRHRTMVRCTIALGTASLLGALGGPGVCGLPPAEPSTVKDYGAVGDGIADDTAAIQAMVDASAGTIRFPRGRYRLTRPILVDLHRVGPTSFVSDGTATLVMAGPGPALKLVGTHDGTASPDTVREDVWQRERTPMINGLEIVGEHPQAVGIEATGTMQATFTRLVIRRARRGIHLVDRNRNVVISDCHLYENRGEGLYLDHVNLHQINVGNCHISYNGGGGIVVRGGVVRNLQIANCDIEGNMAPEGPPTANVLFDTADGSIREGAIVGCTIQHTHDAAGSANIRFLGHSRELPLRVGNFTIADNVLSDVAVNIHLVFARGVTITGNTFWKAFEHNLHVEGCTNIVVGQNLFDRNPEYRPINSQNGLLFVDCADATLSGLHVNHVILAPAGLILRRCRRVNVTNSTILNCDTAGILLEDAEQVRVSDCLIGDDRDGRSRAKALIVRGGRHNMIVDNLMTGEVEIAPGTALIAGNHGVEP